MHTSNPQSKSYCTNGIIMAKVNFHFGGMLLWKHILIKNVYQFLDFILWSSSIPHGKRCWASWAFCVMSYSKCKKKKKKSLCRIICHYRMKNYFLCYKPSAMLTYMYVHTLYTCRHVNLHICANFNTEILILWKQIWRQISVNVQSEKRTAIPFICVRNTHIAIPLISVELLVYATLTSKWVKTWLA